ncbi:hypothetical protein DICVIV_10072 [Dictyocaulus viviparus]|uniref:Uncharacterized protein n=1 Tax=Dictyocaulus viviparus TaxID=29172 RepID=A0A0D8XNG0_DICVI|nr:hypothetical protein DICVIV_10072 [Dictyocaulus viviparus]
MTMCHTKSTLTNAGRRRIPDFSPDKKIYERLRKDMLMNDRPENPFDEIGTRSPPLSGVEELFVEQTERPKKHFYDLNDYYRYRYKKYYQTQQYAQNSLLYRVYPGLHPKNSQYCPNMRGMFAYTCQPSKPLRVDLVEFCKDYSAFCNVPNFHRLPGPRLGPPIDRSIGHVGVSGKFGLGVGALPGFDVGVGSGVDVGPIPGLTEDVGVGLGLDVGVVGAKSPEAFRRGQDNPNEKGGGVVGISGGVGVKAPGAGDIGVGSGIGVGK